MEKAYYAIQYKDGNFLTFIFDDRFEETVISHEDLSLEFISDIIFDKLEDVEYEINNIINRSFDFNFLEVDKYELSDLKLVKLNLSFNSIVEEI